tara:strand:+ start:306 stop:569 length:264 start_codon:yes stop_codon:yes gene_type:complete
MENNLASSIETDPQKICLKLIDEFEISRIYNSKKDVTTFTLKFPSWLKENYTPETVKYLIDTITPLIIEEMNRNTNKECIQVIKENV